MDCDQGSGAAETQGDDPAWEEACRREEAIREFLRRHPKGLTYAAVDGVASELGVSRMTVYRLIQSFRSAGTVTSLLPRSRGRPQGLRMRRCCSDPVIGGLAVRSARRRRAAAV